MVWLTILANADKGSPRMCCHEKSLSQDFASTKVHAFHASYAGSLLVLNVKSIIKTRHNINTYRHVFVLQSLRSSIIQNHHLEVMALVEQSFLGSMELQLRVDSWLP